MAASPPPPPAPSEDRAPRATPAVLSSGAVAIRRPRTTDIPSLIGLRALPQNRLLVQVADTDSAWLAMLQDIGTRPWGLPMVAGGDGAVTTFLTTALPDVRAARAYLLVLLADLEVARVALRLYLRHVFWSFPVQRLYAQVPRLAVTQPHLDLLGSAGFVDEGTYPGHGEGEGRWCDVAVLGLLRDDFEREVLAGNRELAL